jgi:GH3 auxin-responsive promoter
MDTIAGASTGWSRLSRRMAIRDLVNMGFHLGARLRTAELDDGNAALIQARTLRKLVHRARRTRFGRDHRFNRIGSVADFQAAVPIRTYESLWADYLRDHYPVFQDLTWPGLIPFLALTSGTTQGATKYIPVSAEMAASNRKAASTMLAFHYRAHPESRLFHGRLFFLGGSAELRQAAPGVSEGDLSGIAAVELNPFLRPYTFPPLDLALEPDWDRKLSRFAEQSRREPITLVGGVPSWLLMLFQRLLDLSSKTTLVDVWPELELVVHGGVKFDPYREAFRSIVGSPRVRLLETYVCSEAFVAFGDPRTELLRLVYDHGVFFEFVPVAELDAPRPTRHWLGNVEPGVNYALIVSTCAGMWAHVIGDTIRFESVDPPLLTFTGRTRQTLSAFGEHVINEELEGAVACAATATGASVRDWHVGPIFEGALGYHQYVVEFLVKPTDERRFRDLLDEELSRRNADYQAHRTPGACLPSPALRVAGPGVFEGWMRRRGKLGGQNKVPRVDNSGMLTRDLLEYLDETHQSIVSVPPGDTSAPGAGASASAAADG